MSETFPVMGEKCGIASPPDTSVSSTSCVDNQPSRQSTVFLGNMGSLLTLDGCCKESGDTGEGEVTSSSEIFTKLWNAFPSSFDGVYSEQDKNSLSGLTDEDLSCLQTALSTDEGVQILQQALMKDLMSGYGTDEKTTIEQVGAGVVDERQFATFSLPMSEPMSEPLFGSSYEQVNAFQSFDHMRPAFTLNGSQPCMNDFTNAIIPEMFPASVSDALYSDILDVLSYGHSEEQRLFDDDDDDDYDLNHQQINIDPSHIDDLILADMPPVDGRDGQLCEPALDLEADKDLEIDETLLQSLSFIDQSYAAIADNRESNLDFIFTDCDKFTDEMQFDSCSDFGAEDSKYDLTDGKQLRRSTRIQENEQREMAQKIREENNLKEKEALRIDDQFPEDLERQQKDELSHVDSLFFQNQDSAVDEHVGISYSSGGSGKGSMIQLSPGKSIKAISPQKRQVGLKGKGKGCGKGGKIGKHGSPTLKTIHDGSKTETPDGTQDANCAPEAVDDTSCGSCLPFNEEKLDQLAEKKSSPELLSVKVNECSFDQAITGDLLFDQKLKAKIKVRLGRLDLDSSLLKSVVDSSHIVDKVGQEDKKPEQEDKKPDQEDKNPEQDSVFVKPRTVKRRKRKRTDSGVDTASKEIPEDERRDCESVANVDMDARFPEENVVGVSEPAIDDTACQSVGKNRPKSDHGETGTRKKVRQIGVTEKSAKQKTNKSGEKDGSFDQNIGKKKSPGATFAFTEESPKKRGVKTVKNSPKKLKDSCDKSKEIPAKVPQKIEALFKDTCLTKDEGKKRQQELEKARIRKRTSGGERVSYQEHQISVEKALMAEKLKSLTEERVKNKSETQNLRCQGCLAVKQSPGLFCGKSCRFKYAKRIIGHLREEKQKQQSLFASGEVRSSRALVLIERSTMKRVSVSLDCSETKLLHWLLRHPKYDVLRPNGQATAESATKERVVMKRKLKRTVSLEEASTVVSEKATQPREQSSEKVNRIADRPIVGASNPLNRFSSLNVTASTKTVKTADKDAEKNEIKSSLSTKAKSSISASPSLNQKPRDVVASRGKALAPKDGPKKALSTKVVPPVALSVNHVTTVDHREVKKKVDGNDVTFTVTFTGNPVTRRNSAEVQNRNCPDDFDAGKSESVQGAPVCKYGSNNSVKLLSQREHDGKSDKHDKGGKTPSREGVDSKDRLPGSEVGLDPARIGVRTEFHGIVTSKVNRSNDVLLSATEIRRLIASVEDALWSHCRKVSGNYKQKSRALLSHLTDPKNLGLFRQVLRGYVKPDQLMRTVFVAGSVPAQDSGREKESVIQKQSKPAASSSLAISDSTSMHGQHVFDVGCRICTGNVFRSTAQKRNNGIHPKNGNKREVRDSTIAEKPSCDIDVAGYAELEKTKQIPAVAISSRDEPIEIEIVDLSKDVPLKHSANDEPASSKESIPLWLNSSPVIIPKNSPNPDTDLIDPRDRTRVIPRNSSLCRIKQYSASAELSASSGLSHPSELPHDPELDAGDDAHQSSPGSLVWKGSIFARDVTLLAVDAFQLSGSMKYIRTVLPESLTVMGRLEPEVVYEYLTKLKTCYSATKEVAVVCFRASNDPNSSLYSLLFSYLHQRNRCGVIGSIGSVIKDMYVVPLPAKSPIPDVLLPDIGSVLTRGCDLLLGVVVQQISRSTPLSSRSGSKSHSGHRTVPRAGVPEIKTEWKAVAESDEKCSSFKPLESPDVIKTGRSRSSDSSDSESVDTEGNDAIITEYSKPASLALTSNKEPEEDDSIDKTVNASIEDNVDTIEDDGDEPYDPFDGEDDDLGSDVKSDCRPKPVASESSSSSSLAPSVVPSLPDNPLVVREDITGLAALLSHVAHIPDAATLLAALASEPFASSVGDCQPLIAQLALLFQSQANPQRQNPTDGKYDGSAVSFFQNFVAKAISADGVSPEKESSCGTDVESKKVCDDRHTGGVEAKSGKWREGGNDERQKSDDNHLQADVFDDIATDPLDRIGDNTPAKPTQASVIGKNPAVVGKKSFPSGKNISKFRDLEEDDNEDHLIIDLDSPQIDEDERNGTCFTGKLPSSASSADVGNNKLDEFGKDGFSDSSVENTNPALELSCESGLLPCDSLANCKSPPTRRSQKDEANTEKTADGLDIEESADFDEEDEDLFSAVLSSVDVESEDGVLNSDVEDSSDVELQHTDCRNAGITSDFAGSRELDDGGNTVRDADNRDATLIPDLSKSDVNGDTEPVTVDSDSTESIRKAGGEAKSPWQSLVEKDSKGSNDRPRVAGTGDEEKSIVVAPLPAPPLPPEFLLAGMKPFPEPLLRPPPSPCWTRTFSGSLEVNLCSPVCSDWPPQRLGRSENQWVNSVCSGILVREPQTPPMPLESSLVTAGQSRLREEQKDKNWSSDDLQDWLDDVPVRILSTPKDRKEILSLSENNEGAVPCSPLIPDAQLWRSIERKHIISTGMRRENDESRSYLLNESDLKKVPQNSFEKPEKSFDQTQNICDVRSKIGNSSGTVRQDWSRKYGERGLSRQRETVRNSPARFKRITGPEIRPHEFYDNRSSDGKRDRSYGSSERRETKRRLDETSLDGSDAERLEDARQLLVERRRNGGYDHYARRHRRFVDSSSDDRCDAYGRNRSRLQNADTRWSKTVSRRPWSRQNSSPTTVVLSRRGNNFDPEEREEDVCGMASRGGVWKREVRLRTVTGDRGFCTEASEEKVERISEKPTMEILISGGKEDEQEEGEYVDEQDEDEIGQILVEPVRNLKSYDDLQSSPGISQNLEGSCLSGDTSLPYRRLPGDVDTVGFRKLDNLVVQIEDVGDGKNVGCDDDDELEDGEIADASPTEADIGGSSPTFCDDMHGKEFLPLGGRNSNTPSAIPSLFSDLCWSSLPRVPLLNFGEKPANLADDYQRRSNPAHGDDNRSCGDSMISPADGIYDHYDRSSSHRRKYNNDRTGLKDSSQYYAKTSRDTFWNSSRPQRSGNRRLHHQPTAPYSPS